MLITQTARTTTKPTIDTVHSQYTLHYDKLNHLVDEIKTLPTPVQSPDVVIIAVDTESKSEMMSA